MQFFILTVNVCDSDDKIVYAKYPLNFAILIPRILAVGAKKFFNIEMFVGIMPIYPSVFCKMGSNRISILSQHVCPVLFDIHSAVSMASRRFLTR